MKAMKFATVGATAGLFIACAALATTPASATAGDRYITDYGWGTYQLASGYAISMTIRCNDNNDKVISGGAKIVTSGGGDYDGVDFRQSYPFLGGGSSRDGWTLRLVNSGASTAYITPQALCEEV